MKNVISNLVLFKLGWIACIGTAAMGNPWLGACAVAVVALIHIATASEPSKTLYLLGCAAAIGLIWESILVTTGVLDYGVNGHSEVLAPYWIVAMWVLFATTLNLGFRWLKPKLGIAAAFGAIGGPLAFFAGEKAGAVIFPDATIAIIAIAVGWAVLLPLLVFVSRYFDGHLPAPLSPYAAEGAA